MIETKGAIPNQGKTMVEKETLVTEMPRSIIEIIVEEGTIKIYNKRADIPLFIVF